MSKSAFQCRRRRDGESWTLAFWLWVLVQGPRDWDILFLRHRTHDFVDDWWYRQLSSLPLFQKPPG
jgi:hypothetical protein